MRRTRIPPLAALAIALAAAACESGDISEPCEQLVGDVRVVVDSFYAAGFRLRANDSVQVGASVRRIESARAVLVTNFTVCEATFGDPLDRPVNFFTTNESIAAVRSNGWVVGRGVGLAVITVASDTDVEPAQFPVEVTQ